MASPIPPTTISLRNVLLRPSISRLSNVSFSMPFSELGSAMDDSFDPTLLPPPPGSAGSVCSNNLNGPRSGHWTVGSNINSAIDDRCRTVWGSSAGAPIVGQPHAHADPIAASLLRKLAKASLEKQIALDAEGTTYSAVRDTAFQHGSALAPASPPKQDSTPKGFYMPRMKDAAGMEFRKKIREDKMMGGAQSQIGLREK